MATRDAVLNMPPLESIGKRVGPRPLKTDIFKYLNADERARYESAQETLRNVMPVCQMPGNVAVDTLHAVKCALDSADHGHASEIVSILKRAAKARRAKARTADEPPPLPQLADELKTLAAMAPDERSAWDRSHPDNHCAACKKSVQSEAELKMCQGCRGARYCSEACQRAHWHKHGPACGPKPQQGIGAEVGATDEWRGRGGGYYSSPRYGYRPASVAGGILGGLAGGLVGGLAGGLAGGYGYPYGGYGYDDYPYPYAYA